MAQHRNNRKPKFNEWYTPQYVFDVIVELLESEFPIEVDMYSSEQANKRVKANYFFTKENPWDNDVAITKWGESKINGWANPPYLPHTLISEAIDSILICRKHNVFSNCFLLLNANMETKYSQKALTNCDYVFFFNKRISFIDARTGKPKEENTKGQALYYFGDKKLSSQFTRDDGVLLKSAK